MSDNDYFNLVEEIKSFPPGTQVTDKDGEVWVRMEDSISHHLEDYYCNINSGKYLHASRLACRLP